MSWRSTETSSSRPQGRRPSAGSQILRRPCSRKDDFGRHADDLSCLGLSWPLSHMGFMTWPAIEAARIQSQSKLSLL
jgi:hypothetical protein